MKNKKIILWSIVILLCLAVGGGIFYYFYNENSKTTLTLAEKQWIENNKNQVFDMGVMNDVLVFTHEGIGVFFDFLTDLEEDTELEFNKLSYERGEESTATYQFRTVEKPGKKDIVFYEDNYAILSVDNEKYNDLKELSGKTFGVLKSDVASATKYLDGASDIKLQPFDNAEEMISTLEKDDNTINGIILPKIHYLKEILESKKLNIAYNIASYKTNYVLTLGDDNRLNNILEKYSKKWLKESFDDSYHENFNNAFFSYTDYSENDRAKFQGKRYTYGFVENIPFDTIMSGKLLGMNSNLIKEFSDLSDIEISFKEFDNYTELVNAFNANDVDFFLEFTPRTNYKMDVIRTVSPYHEEIVISSLLKDNVVIQNLYALEDQEVAVVSGTKIETMLKKYNIHTKGYNNVEDLLEHVGQNPYFALDYNTYKYYEKSKLKDYKIDYLFDLNDNYRFVVRDIKDNRVFEDYLDFYLSFIEENKIMNQSYEQLFLHKQSYFIRNLIILVVGFSAIALGYFIYKKIKSREKQKIVIGKNDKLQYIDMLTSLKNRTYLNDQMKTWDESGIYPQAIVIVDLNNVAYVNDNYGHTEGDNLIKEAANKLITTQIENSEIMRTNGNEFLIYLVGYEEKQVVSYIRKLNKEFKDISHGFGAAIGYSMITDAIKTIDDAINEATQDMKNNKEENNG